ncbi:MAG: L-serine ammonia-lyase [Sulfurospirillaceae bacterium]|nr:L-serine ammonia-lyase [Sulfurospirillaceae bacterium]
MNYSVLEVFKIGIGPSSSHTVGPMKIGRDFAAQSKRLGFLQQCHTIKIEFFGSLAATGRGHGSDKAIILGLCGYKPHNISAAKAEKTFESVKKSSKINLLDIKKIGFDFNEDLIFNFDEFLEFHPNAVRLYMYDKQKICIFEKTYYSIGGGEVLDEKCLNKKEKMSSHFPYEFKSSKELLEMCKTNDLSISALMMENEKHLKSEAEVKKALINIWKVMKNCVENGCQNTGCLPKTGIKRRANVIYEKLSKRSSFSMVDPLEVLDWVDLWALAVNEENACGGIVVTAPTNGAAGIIPSVMHYMNRFLGSSFREYDEQKIVDFLLTAGAIGILYKKNASISGADVGCQGEVGVACSMAAGALAEAMGGSVEQVENAAEIGMEHNLGLTCDPVGGLVQVPCIERNAMASIKAINAARMALNGDGKHFISLDNVIKTMFETGKDMMNKYKETSQGGLAVNMVVC